MEAATETAATKNLEWLEEAAKEALFLLNKDYLIGDYCVRHKIDPSDIFNKTGALHDNIEKLKATGTFQFGIPIMSKPGPTVTINYQGAPKEMIMFASNDYLNLSTDARVHDAIRETLDNYGVGAGSSRVGTGYSDIHRQLEEKLAAKYGKEAGLLFPTGYDAISSTIAALLSPADRVVVDSGCHNCIIDGCERSGATVRLFRHNDLERLEDNLRRARDAVKTGGGLLVVVEGAYSMDGDISPLPQIVVIARKYGARVMVDEAHAIGVLGARGFGATEHYKLEKEIDIIAGTFSKSLGAVGGFIVADRKVVTYVNYISRRIIFSAAFPPLLARAVSRAIDIMESDNALRARLHDNVNYLAAGFRKLGVTLPDIEIGAVPVHIGKDEIMFHIGGEMFEAGLFTYPVVYPTVPRGRSMFRLAVQSGHTRAHLDRALDVFAGLLKKYEILKS